jgi:hypothetical protein
MADTLLSIVQQAASQLGLRQPSAVVGSTDLTAQILLRFAVQAGKELVRYHDWQALTVEHTFTATATITQTASAIPTAFGRFVYNPEIWDRSSNQKYFGPTPQRTWQQILSSSGTGSTRRWRKRGNSLLLTPAPTSGNTFAYEYVSKNFCESSSGTDQETWMADTDVPLIPDYLFILEMVWRFRHSRGFAQYAEDLVTCNIEKEKEAARDRGTGRIMGGNANDIPEPTFNGTIDG